MWIIGLAIVVGCALIAWVLDSRLSFIGQELDGILLTLVKSYRRAAGIDADVTDETSSRR